LLLGEQQVVVHLGLHQSLLDVDELLEVDEPGRILVTRVFQQSGLVHQLLQVFHGLGNRVVLVEGVGAVISKVIVSTIEVLFPFLGALSAKTIQWLLRSGLNYT
jgi:hypothetical protein